MPSGRVVRIWRIDDAASTSRPDTGGCDARPQPGPPRPRRVTGETDPRWGVPGRSDHGCRPTDETPPRRADGGCPGGWLRLRHGPHQDACRDVHSQTHAECRRRWQARWQGPACSRSPAPGWPRRCLREGSSFAFRVMVGARVCEFTACESGDASQMSRGMRDSPAHVGASGGRPQGRLQGAVRHCRGGRVRDQPAAAHTPAPLLPRGAEESPVVGWL
jgi:hypothetical protein